MATCAHCNIQETEIHEKGVPICVKCAQARCQRKPANSEKNIRVSLLQELFRATTLCVEATREFDEVTSQIERLPNPDPKYSIIEAARKLTIARNDVMIAQNRLSIYLKEEDAPENLQRKATA